MAFCLGMSMLVLAGNLVWSLLFRREPAEANPWQSKSLEFQLPSPVPAHNFDRIPVINSAPYAYGIPDAPPVADLGPVVAAAGPAVAPEGGVA
jgi:cytochrome c oxidase subunit 1